MPKKPNYELKAQVIGNGCAKIQRKLSLTEWKYQQLFLSLETGKEEITEENIKTLNKQSELMDKLTEEISHFSEEEIEEAVKVNRAGYQRTKRLKDRILKLLENQNAIFVTLTFRNSVLENTNEQTRRDYVRKYLKSQCLKYVANIDFGKTNEREHYHAVVVPKSNELDGKKYREQCGQIDFERVWHKANELDYENTAKRMAKYVNKLTNHAIKETTRQNRVMYSRD